MVDAGMLENPKVDAVFGLHLITVQSIAESSGAKAEVNFLKPSYRATVNDVSLSASMLPAMQQYLTLSA